MKNKTNKSRILSYALGAIIALMVIPILYFRTTSKNQQIATPTPTPSFSADLTTQEAIDYERNVKQTLEDTIRTRLSQKNGWDLADYTINIVHVDPQMVAGNIISTTNVPEGIFLMKNVGDNNFDIIFDSTTPEPCSLLEPNIVYPQAVTDMCDSPNKPASPSQGGPAPTDALNN
jgi:hypothetical protein